MGEPAASTAGLLDTSIVVDCAKIPGERFPNLAAISTITLAEMSAGPHLARRDPAE